MEPSFYGKTIAVCLFHNHPHWKAQDTRLWSPCTPEQPFKGEVCDFSFLLFFPFSVSEIICYLGRSLFSVWLEFHLSGISVFGNIPVHQCAPFLRAPPYQRDPKRHPLFLALSHLNTLRITWKAKANASDARATRSALTGTETERWSYQVKATVATSTDQALLLHRCIFEAKITFGKPELHQSDWMHAQVFIHPAGTKLW